MAQNATVEIYPQIVNRIPKTLISDAVGKYKTDYRAKGARHADAFYTLLFHQLSGSVSMRDTILGMTSCKDNGYEKHCGFMALKRSTLSYVLAHRNYQVFEHLYMSLYKVLKPELQGRLSSTRCVTGRLAQLSTTRMAMRNSQKARPTTKITALLFMVLGSLKMGSLST